MCTFNEITVTESFVTGYVSKLNKLEVPVQQLKKEIIMDKYGKIKLEVCWFIKKYENIPGMVTVTQADLDCGVVDSDRRFVVDGKVQCLLRRLRRQELRVRLLTHQRVIPSTAASGVRSVVFPGILGQLPDTGRGKHSVVIEDGVNGLDPDSIDGPLGVSAGQLSRGSTVYV